MALSLTARRSRKPDGVRASHPVCVSSNQSRMAGPVPVVGRKGLRDGVRQRGRRDAERHFREKNWTGTKLELFFNHKKRYKAFPWDGDETRFENDYPYFGEYARLMKLAMPAKSPVQWVFRTDASWTMGQNSSASRKV